MYSTITDHHHDQGAADNNMNAGGGGANSLLYGLAVLTDKVHQLRSLVTAVLLSPSAAPPVSSTAAMHSAIQEIIVTASSMLLSFQHHQNAAVSSRSPPQQQQLGQTPLYNAGNNDHHITVLDWPYGHDQNDTNDTALMNENDNDKIASGNYEIVELDASNLLAKYTHYCQICGKGFKRDANLRMHMRAHGDEYKTSAALSNPAKNSFNRGETGSVNQDLSGSRVKKYSCPQEGCRWNQRHAKFQPLKSMICVKNHYKRSHCPKMYVCKRCNRKQFSVLSDLRTHEKHCGDLKWQCSCGTTFSRKDKLMGHVTLFVGHTPVTINSSSSSSYYSYSSKTSNNNIHNKTAKVESQLLSQSQIHSIVKMIE